MKLFNQIFMGLMALAFAKVGIEALISPGSVVANVGIVLDNPAALSSIRAVYGGLHLMLGLYCLWGAVKSDRAPVVVVLLYTSGFVTGRIFSIAIDGIPNSFVLTWLATETICLAISGLLLARWKNITHGVPAI